VRVLWRCLVRSFSGCFGIRADGFVDLGGDDAEREVPCKPCGRKEQISVMRIRTLVELAMQIIAADERGGTSFLSTVPLMLISPRYNRSAPNPKPRRSVAIPSTTIIIPAPPSPPDPRAKSHQTRGIHRSRPLEDRNNPPAHIRSNRDTYVARQSPFRGLTSQSPVARHRPSRTR
jgi:hypothetical protein